MNRINHELEKQVGSPLFQQLKKNQRWFFWLGIGLILAGIAAITFSTISTEFFVIYFGFFVVTFGVLEAAKAFSMRLWRGYFLLHLFLGIFFGIAGMLMIINPIQNAIMLTLLWAIFFMIAGVVRIITALTHHVPHQGLMIVNGILNLLLGALIYWQWPASGLWVIGMFVGIDVLFAGLSLVMVSSMVKQIQ